MSSQVLALKYRPQNFDEVVGQEVTVRILKNALLQKKFHHAYLFTGPRGIGKTSLARIFAKTLNCETGPTATPCNNCVSCREITEGRSLSVLEIDGASNTSVDDVRNLREGVRYLPPGGRYKIYIIDEVHMLSTAAFNALLKTLEEPPPHALFLFATTESQKIPATILSRLIRFDLHPLSSSQIVRQLQKIAQSELESIEVNEEALTLIAREAGGSLRDGLGLFDQILSFSGQKVTKESVEEVIGVSTRRFVLDLIGSILKQDASAVLKISESAFASGVETKRFALDLLENLRHLLVARLSQDPSLFDIPLEEVNRLATLAQTATEEDLDRLFRIFQHGVVEILRSPLPKVLFDVLLLRLCHTRGLRSLDEILKRLTDSSSSGEVFFEASRPLVETAPLFETEAPKKGWPGFLAALRSNKPQLYSLIQEGRFVQLGETEVVLQFPSQSIAQSLLQDAGRESILGEQVKQFFGRPLAIRYEVEREAPAAEAPARNLNLVDEAISIFGPGTTLS